MKKNFILTFLCSTLFINGLFSQSRVELRNIFYEAESWILYEDYKEALPLYLTLLRIFPQNSNIKYRIGQCYINTPGEKDKAMKYLEDAARNIDPNYKKGKFTETGAPYDALFYLANAYLINNILDKALETFNLFSKNLDPRVYDTAVVRLQIKSCLNAKGMISKPVYIKETNLGSRINRGNSENNPVVSDNEDLLVFTRSYPFYDALLYSTKDAAGRWSVPVNMNEILKVDNYFYPTSLSHDGKDLYLYSSVDYDGIIYTTRYENGTWSPLVKLNNNINTKFWESHATISHDNKKLYFTSNRKGTFGGLDIYVSVRDSSGNWGVANNLGPVINTPYNEESPFLSQDDKTLYFSSRGHYGMGGYDYFYSTLLENGQWSVPLNVGYPMNTTDDDVFFKPLNDGYEGYLAKYNPDGYGKQDLYKIEIFSEEHPRKFLVKGIAKVPFKSTRKNEPVEIIARNTETPGKSVIVKTDPGTGAFAFNLPYGNYEFSYKAPGAETLKRKVLLPISNPSDTLALPGATLARSDLSAFLSVLGSRNRLVSKPDPVIIRLKVEPNSILTVRRSNGKKLLASSQFSLKDSLFTYEMVPVSGVNAINFRLTDSYNNKASENVYVTLETPHRTIAARLPERKKPVAGMKLTAYSEIGKLKGVDDLVAIRTALPAQVNPALFAGTGKLWIIGVFLGAGLILFIIFYKKRRNKEARTE